MAGSVSRASSNVCSALWTENATMTAIHKIEEMLASREKKVFLQLLTPVYIVVRFRASYEFAPGVFEEVGNQFLEMFKSVRGTDDVTMDLSTGNMAFQFGPEVGACPHVDIHIRDVRLGIVFLDTVRTATFRSRPASETMEIF